MKLLLSLAFLVFYLNPVQAHAWFNLKGSYNDTGVIFTPPLPPHQLSQSFTASHANLHAIEVMVKSAAASSQGQFTLNLFNADSHLVASSSALVSLTQHKAFLPFSFPPLSDSKGQMYTFNLNFHPIPGTSPLVVNRSRYNAYQSGTLNTDASPVDSDLVFRTYYLRPGSFFSLVIDNLIFKTSSDPLFFGLYLIFIITLGLYISYRLNHDH